MNTQIKIGNYTILNSIGAGTFGKVKLAIHCYTGHKVALKILNRRRIVKLNMVSRLKREVQYLKTLNNPHIIKLYEVITTPTDIILVLEYAGGELFNYIVDKGRMSEGEARSLFQQIVFAVEHCHLQKIVHRDLKPENILMDANQNIKLADFGLSNFLEDGDFLKTSCGSPNYAAPEVISGKMYAGPEIDVWSCGVILYVMLCGQLPFDDDHIPTLFKKINSGVFRLPSYLSSGAKELLSSMLVVDPLKRITIPEIRKSQWFSKDLPDYLSISPLAKDRHGNVYNQQLVTKISQKMKFSEKTVLHALSEQENNQIKVAYQLYLDHQPKATTVDPVLTVLKNAHITNYATEASSVQIMSNSLPLHSKQEFPDPRKSRSNRSRWHYGIRSRSDPIEIMLELFKALQRTSIVWKAVDPYKLRCVYTSVRGESVKFEIQLYQIEVGNFLVDFKIVSNCMNVSCESGTHLSSFTFIDACTRLITELAVGG